MLVYKQKEGGTVAENYEIDGVSPLLAKLMAQRGVATRAQAEAFLDPQPAQLHDPLTMENMAAICARIKEALAAGQKICVYGDYDVDGVTSASILSMYLRSLGGDVTVYIPSRHEEGYGLNLKALEKLTQERELIISVDCGITSVQEVAYVKGLGRDIIVTDHHQLPPELPSCLCLNPLMGDYAFRKLCGAGVAMKILQAMGGLEALEPYWDLAAMGTVADIVPLMDENRVFASVGLKRMNGSMRPGIAALCRVANIKTDEQGRYKLTAGNIGFQLAPRVNAGGRMESAVQCVELMTSNDPMRVEELAERLNEDNAERQKQELEMIAAAEKMLENADFTSFRVIMICGEGWNPGVVGLASSRLTDKYHYPSIVMTKRDGMCVGSCRSIKGVDIFAALSSCKDLFTRFGGHPQAAGLTLPEEKLPEFTQRLNAWLRENVDSRVYLPEMEYDCDIDPADMNIDIAREMELLAPTGFGNPSPLFRVQATVRSAMAVGRDGAHMKAVLSADGMQTGAIGFRMGERAAAVMGTKQDIIFSLGINSYMGTERVQAELKALNSISPNASIAQLAETAEKDYISYLDRMLYNININIFIPPAITPGQLVKLLAHDAQGIILHADTPAALKRTLIMLGGLGVVDMPDVSRGFPDDRRAFNAMCLCASGMPPKGYKYYVSLSGRLDPSYAGQLNDAGIKVMRLAGAPDTPDMKPTDDLMRAAYKYVAVNRLALAGMADIFQLSNAVAQGTGMTQPQALATLHIFRELKLAEFEKDGTGFTVPAMHKVNLSDSLIYRRLGEKIQ